MKRKETHPSFGQLQISTVTSSRPEALYGSALKHSNMVRLTLKRSERMRNLSQAWYHPTTQVVEFEMSSQQWAEAISSMNQGSGTPVTIKWIMGEGSIEDCPESQERELFNEEFTKDLKDILGNASGLIEKCEGILDQKTVRKRTINEVLADLRKLKQDINANLPFVNKQFQRSVDKAVSSAKHDIESYMQHRIKETGLEAIGKKYVPPQLTDGGADE